MKNLNTFEMKKINQKTPIHQKKYNEQKTI